MRITRQTIRCTSSYGYEDVSGYVHSMLPGLAVTPACFVGDRGWMLIHVPSGLRCRSMENRKVAILTLKYLAGTFTKINWTLSGDNLLQAYPSRILSRIFDEAIAAQRGRLRQGFLFAT